MGGGGGNHVLSIINQGGRGVQLFFVASAFTLFYSLSNKNTTHNIGYNFYIRRFFRIAPMYYLGIIYYLIQDGFGPRFWLGDAPGITNWHIISNIFFLHSFNPYAMSSVVPGGWSIAIEVLFYCFVPFLFLKIKRLNQAIGFLLFSILLNIFLYILLNRANLISDTRLWGNYLNLFFPSQLPVFACGIIMFFLITAPKTEWKVNPFFILVFGLLFLLDLSFGINIFFGLHILFSITFIGIGFALSRKEFLILVNPVSQYIGKISYSMYLVHFAILHWLSKFNYINFIASNSVLDYFAIFFIVLTLSVFLASITYNLVEVPFQKLGAKLIRGLHNPNVA